MIRFASQEAVERPNNQGGRMTSRRTAGKSAADRRIPTRDRLIVALDVPDVSSARKIVKELGPDISFYKIGMRLQFAGGLRLAQELVDRDKKVLLDSKLFDIDQTITDAVHNISRMGVDFLTIHGASKTIQAAVKGRGNSKLQLLVVTVLTNLVEHDIRDMGYNCSIDDLVLYRARTALNAGADGVIASGVEGPKIRDLVGNALKIVMPGIRPDGSEPDDQKRVVTPSQAIESGADYLVVGRPILKAHDRKKAAIEILHQIENALTTVSARAA